MVLANTASGLTHSFDLRDSQSLQDLLYLIRSKQVTAISITHNGVQQVLPIPKRFKDRPIFGAELVTNSDSAPIAERIYAQVGSVRVILTRTFSSKLVRTDLVRTGRQLYDPHQSRGVCNVKP